MYGDVFSLKEMKMDDWHEQQRRIEKRALLDELGFFLFIGGAIVVALAVLCVAVLIYSV